MTESKLQIQCISWFRFQYPKLKLNLFHVPNGGRRSKREGAKFKREGVISGIPDILFLHNGELHAIELKTPARKNNLSENQKEVHESWKRQSVETVVFWTFEQFQEFIINIIE